MILSYRHQEKEFHHEEHEEHEESKEKPLNLSLPLFVLFVSSWFYFLEVYSVQSWFN